MNKTVAAARKATTMARVGTFEEKLSQLEQQFLHSLPMRLSVLCRLVTAARHRIEAREEAIVLTHQLRGLAGTLGLADVGRELGALEELLDHPLVGQSSHDASVAITEMIDRLQRWRPSSTRPAGVDRRAHTQGEHEVLIVATGPLARLGQEVAKSGGLVLVQDRAAALAAASRSHFDKALVALSDFEDSKLCVRELRMKLGAAHISVVQSGGTIEQRVGWLQAGASSVEREPEDEHALSLLCESLGAQGTRPSRRVMLIDDDPTVGSLQCELLRAEGFEVSVVDRADDLLEHINAFRPELLLLDVNLPGIGGIEVCRALRATGQHDLLPIVVYTAREDLSTRVKALEAGANDVIVKSAASVELVSRVRAQLARASMVERRADTDALTGLLLRRTLEERVSALLHAAERAGKVVSVALIDLDHFKKVNDSFGHNAGDRVLARVGRLLARRVRSMDCVARWGGEEMVVVFAERDRAAAKRAMDRALAKVNALVMTADDGRRFNVSFTAGIAAFPCDGRSLAELMTRADARLYAGKRAGRGCVINHDER